MKIKITEIEAIQVARVKSENGTSGAKQAFTKLESGMSSLKGRKMYGVFYPSVNAYYACVELDEENPDDMGFEKNTIPGGKYAKKKLENWTSKIHEIGPAFDVLVESCAQNGNEIDQNRPSVEFYKSLSELVLMVPVK